MAIWKEVLAHPAVQLDADFCPQGVDFEFATGKWGRLWQLDNQVRKMGLAGSLDLSTPLEAIAENAESLSRCLVK